MTSVASEIRNFACPQCGSKKVTFDPKSGNLKCPNCGWEDAIPASAEQVEERSYEQYLTLDRTELAKLAPQALEVKCPGCGAITTFAPPQVAGDCPFCGTNIQTPPQAAAASIPPNGILPFHLERKSAQERIQTWLGSNWFAPNDLKKAAQPEAIQGVYLPFWTYDALTVSHYQGERGENYTVTVSYQETNSEGETETKTREEIRTNWYFTSGRVDRFFDDVMIPASHSVNTNHLKNLQPWNHEKMLKPYEPAYLAGYKVERYQTGLKEGFEVAKQDMARVIEQDIRRDIGGDEQRIHSVSTAYSAITFKHVLLPVWIFSYRYRSKTFQVVTNANTGKVLGDHPIAVWKVVLASIAGAVVAGGVIWLLYHAR